MAKCVRAPSGCFQSPVDYSRFKPLAHHLRFFVPSCLFPDDTGNGDLNIETYVAEKVNVGSKLRAKETIVSFRPLAEKMNAAIYLQLFVKHTNISAVDFISPVTLSLIGM